MTRRKMVGTGITRHQRIEYDPFDPGDRAERERDLEEYADPRRDFPAWLHQQEAWVAQALEHFKLPAPNRLVAYERADLRCWRYEDDDMTPGIHARTEWYLQAFPYQSSFWYLGRLLFLMWQCRIALNRGDYLKLAGQAVLLGQVDREFRLKFSGEKRLKVFERHVAGSDKGNATKRKNADEWKAETRRIISRVGISNIDWSNLSKAAQTVQEAWPASMKLAPSKRSLRAYLGELAKRDVLPETE